MKILLLGGIGEAKQLAEVLTAQGHQVIYSIAGVGQTPTLGCPIIHGGFAQYDLNGDSTRGLVGYLQTNAIERVLDATHPYAGQMSQQVSQACHELDIPLWQWQRPAWRPQAGDCWRYVQRWPQLINLLQPFTRIWFATGASTLNHLAYRPTHQQWLIRQLKPHSTVIDGVQVIAERGPFAKPQERRLLIGQRIQAIVIKNSGGQASYAKVEAARELAIPIFVWQRPSLPRAQRRYQQMDVMLRDLAL